MHVCIGKSGRCQANRPTNRAKPGALVIDPDLTPGGGNNNMKVVE